MVCGALKVVLSGTPSLTAAASTNSLERRPGLEACGPPYSVGTVGVQEGLSVRPRHAAHRAIGQDLHRPVPGSTIARAPTACPRWATWSLTARSMAAAWSAGRWSCG